MPTTQHDFATLKGQPLVGQNDAKLGTIDDIYLDAETGAAEWMAVKTGMFGGKLSFVPLAEAERHDDHVHVPYTKDQVKGAPNADADGALSQDEERRLYEHYGHDYSDSRSEAGLPDGDTRGRTVGRDTSGPTTDDAMTRSEEELEVGTTSREAGRARLQERVRMDKDTVTEDRQVSDEVRKERIDVDGDTPSR